MCEHRALERPPFGHGALEDVECRWRARPSSHYRRWERGEGGALFRNLVQQVGGEVDGPGDEGEDEEVREPGAAGPEGVESGVSKAYDTGVGRKLEGVIGDALQSAWDGHALING